jgi:methylated-DNA-[protein]-cysteine S-methyltransferase
MSELSYYKYFKSPIGNIEITSCDSSIHSLKFVEALGNNSKQQPKVLKDCYTQLKEYFAGERTDFTMPLQQEGTAFQKQVWNELLTISIGKTISYLDLSKKINNIGAIRAVGTANGKNKIAIIVPCHRVIGNDGKLTGYSGGLHRKKWLLEHEAKMMGTFNLLF